MKTIVKGFRVPEDHKLRIDQKDGQSLEKYPGEQSGGRYGIHEVIEGRVSGWSLEKLDDQDSDVSVSQEINGIFDAIGNIGGKPVFVGGFVRDLLTGNANKDIDIEVYGVEADDLTKVLSNFGKVDSVGASFGVIKLTTPANDYDFTLPRTESKQGEGHTGFVVTPDANMSPEDAASRRDFTFNAMAMDKEGNLLDFYGGLEDLKNKVLRHTSEKFAEDPLRVLRAFQFSARFGLTIDPDTAKLAKNLRSEYETLSIERIWGEWEKWALKGQNPSSGLEVLKDTGWLELYPEVFTLIGVQQNPEWHPEGDVWQHTLHVVDAAAEIAKRDNLQGDDRTVLLLAALCHDLGKVTTTVKEDGVWKAPGHPQEGVVPTLSFLRRIGAPQRVIERVVPLVKEHMAHLNPVTEKSVRRLSVRLLSEKIDMLVRIIEADHSGRPPLPAELPESAHDLLQMSHFLKVHQGKPEGLVSGKMLMNLAAAGKIPEGYKTGGPHFGDVISTAYEAQLDGEFEELEGAQKYVMTLLNDSYENPEYDVTLYLASLSDVEKQRLLDTGVDSESLFDMTAEQIQELIKSSTKE